MLTVGSLFAGIGGFDLGFERAGMVARWQVEQDPFCLKVLARHFPNAKRYEDVRDVGRHNLEPVDVICGGVPCQPVSIAGPGLGEDDERWLWPDAVRIIGELRPRYAVLENPAIFLRRGAAGVLGALTQIGYDAEWDCIPASAVGAPHRRERVWIVAYPRGEGLQGVHETRRRIYLQSVAATLRRDWPTEPDLPRLADGIPRRLVLDPIRAYGNALVPMVAEWIAARIVEWES
jgi:DNA (cytosine-5)-methyltransferase 1